MEYGDATPWSNPPTVSFDSSSAPHKEVESAESKERDAKINYLLRHRAELLIELEQIRSFQYNCSFVVYISIAQIVIFVYHVILLGNEGITVNSNGPFYESVNQQATFVCH